VLNEEIDYGPIEESELSGALTKSAREYAQSIASRPNIGGLHLSRGEILSTVGPLDTTTEDLYILRVRYFLQRGWTHMVVVRKGGLRILTNAERAAEAVRRTKHGVRKIERAARAHAATDISKLTRAQQEAHDVAEQYISRRATALRSAQRKK